MIQSDQVPVKTAATVLGVSQSGFYAWRKRKPSARAVRHKMLTEIISGIHADSRGSYGHRRVHAELTIGRGLPVGREQVALLMRRAGLQGATGRRKYRRGVNEPTALDLVQRQFNREDPDRLWVTDLTEHPTAEGKIYCCVVLDTYSRLVVGWAIDSSPNKALATNALSMAISARQPAKGKTIIHSDQGVQFTSWAFTKRAKDAGLLPSMGRVGDCYDNSMIEAFWSRMQVELLDTRTWRTRMELSNAIFDYLEIFHNRQRRHSALGMLTPKEFEARSA